MDVVSFLRQFFSEQVQVKDEDADGLPSDVALSFTDTLADRVKDTVIEFTSVAGPLTIMVALAASNGYFFSGFQPFTFVVFTTFIAWVVGISLELITNSLLYAAARAKKKGVTRWYNSLWGAGLLLSISVVAQYMYLSMEMHLAPASVPNIPIFGWLVGMGGLNNAEVFYLLRSIAMHAAEVFSVFLLAQRGTSIEKLLERQRKIHEYKSQNARQKSAISMEQAVQDAFMAVMEEQKMMVQTRAKLLLQEKTIDAQSQVVYVQAPTVDQTPIPQATPKKAETQPLDFSVDLLGQALGNQQATTTSPKSTVSRNQDAD